MVKRRFLEARARRAAWISGHPLLAALIGALWLTAVLFISVWPLHHPLRGLVVAAVFGGLIGVGLYFVFRDPAYRDPALAAEQKFGRKLWHKVAIGFLVALGGSILIASIAKHA